MAHRPHLEVPFILSYFSGLLHKHLRKMEEAATKSDRTALCRTIMHEAGSLIFGRISGCDEDQVIALLCAFEDGYPYSPEAVAKTQGVSIENVAKLEAKWRRQIARESTERLQRLRQDWLKDHSCQICHTAAGQMHGFECAHEECPFCHTPAWSCLCPYRRLKLGWGGRSAQEWRDLRKNWRLNDAHHPGRPLDRIQHIRPLMMEEKRRWSALITQRGPIPYGNEWRFQ